MASPAWLTLRTGVRYSATSSAFPFTVLITFCILGPEKRPAPQRGGKGSRGTDGSQKKSPLPPTRISTRPAAPKGTGRDGTRLDGPDEGEGRPAPIARAGRALLATQAVRGGPGQGVTWPRGRAAGTRGELGEAGARAPLAFSGAVFSPLLHSRPFRLPLLSLAVAPPPPGPHVTQDSPDT